ncbi:hypothetical protein SBA4_4570015 [Candidatus Sulfopaludibacter sp. SbA4]|nr:hypothetical protein SBA4_4570015 [Candidatus Sulfopaludibacter sp. SbA4]
MFVINNLLMKPLKSEPVFAAATGTDCSAGRVHTGKNRK